LSVVNFSSPICLSEIAGNRPQNHDSVIDGWEALTEDEAIEAAIDKFGKDPTTSVAYCAFAANNGWKPPEYRFWFDLFLKLVIQAHVGWG
jgi:hypothetical protein